MNVKYNIDATIVTIYTFCKFTILTPMSPEDLRNIQKRNANGRTMLSADANIPPLKLQNTQPYNYYGAHLQTALLKIHQDSYIIRSLSINSKNMTTNPSASEGNTQ